MFKRIRKYLAYKIKLLSIEIIPWFIARKFLRKKGKFLFIDCGSNIGQGYTHFKKHFTSDRFEYILIEPKPSCVKTLIEKYRNDVEIIEKSVWTSETRLDLFGLNASGDEIFVGASSLENHNSSIYKTKGGQSILLVSKLTQMTVL